MSFNNNTIAFDFIPNNHNLTSIYYYFILYTLSNERIPLVEK